MVVNPYKKTKWLKKVVERVKYKPKKRRYYWVNILSVSIFNPLWLNKFGWLR